MEPQPSCCTAIMSCTRVLGRKGPSGRGEVEALGFFAPVSHSPHPPDVFGATF